MNGGAGVSAPILAVEGVSKAFTIHLRDGRRLPVLHDLGLEVHPGECVVLGGASGAGKSSVLKMIYGSYGVDTGRILLRRPGGVVDLATASPREVLAARRDTMGYVSQFLRAVPRVPTIDVVAEPLREAGADADAARGRAGGLLTRLGIGERLWELPPATFSGGEQQRVNIARGFIADRPFLLLDEPTASLDARNREVVIALVREKLAAGSGILAIFHDADVRDALADRVVDVERFAGDGRGAAA